MERRKRTEWEEHIGKMDAERLVKISRDNIPAGRSPGRPKRNGATKSLVKQAGSPIKRRLMY